MRLLHPGNCLRFLKLSRISQRHIEVLGLVSVTESSCYTKCKHTDTCLNFTQKNDCPLFKKWKTTSHLGLATSNSLLKYSTRDKDDLSKDAVVQEILKDIKGDFEKEFKLYIGDEEETSPGDSEQQKTEVYPDEKTAKKNDLCGPLGVLSPNSFELGDVHMEIGSGDRLSSINDENEEELLTDEEEDIEDFLDYGYTIEDDDIDVHVYKPPIELKRGTTGVFDLEDLITVLKDEKAIDICVIDVPKSKNYVDYMVIVSGKSARHIKSMAQNIRWLYKQKKHKSDPFIKIEGLNTNNWLAIDLGNAALHIFLPQIREKYDLETLWTVGDIYDDKNLELDDPYAMKDRPLQETNEEVIQDKDEKNVSPVIKVEDSNQIQNLSNKR